MICTVSVHICGAGYIKIKKKNVSLLCFKQINVLYLQSYSIE